MAKPSRATQKKRDRERAQQEKQEEKRAERALRKESRKGDLKDSDGEDPDLAGIIAGPQPPQDDSLN
jgi:hypothetical protein